MSDGGWFTLLMVLAIPAIILCLIWLVRSNSTKREGLERAVDACVAETPDFTAELEISVGPNRPWVLIDRRRRKVLIVNARIVPEPDGGDAVRVGGRLLSTSALLAAELVKGSKTVTATSRTSLAGRALVGGALFGKGGAAVGAVTARTNSQDVATEWRVITTLDDRSDQVLTKTFAANDEHAARSLHASVSAVIRDEDRRAASASQTHTRQQPALSSTSAPVKADDDPVGQIERLHQLLKEGAITQDEYEVLKGRATKRD